jgi:hypothetical protein
MSLYGSGGLTLPTFSLPSMGSGGKDRLGNSKGENYSPNKTTSKSISKANYVSAPSDFLVESSNLGKKKSSTNLLSSSSSGNSSVSFSSSANISSGNTYFMNDIEYSPEEWNEITSKIDDLHLEEENNPLVVSDLLINSLSHEYYSSLAILIYIGKKLSSTFTLMKFAENYFQYDRRVSQTSSSSTSSSSQPGKSTSSSSANNASAHPPSPAQPQVLTNLLEKLISYQGESIKTSLTILNNHSLTNEAVTIFKQIQLFMSAIPSSSSNNSGNSNIYPGSSALTTTDVKKEAGTTTKKSVLFSLDNETTSGKASQSSSSSASSTNIVSSNPNYFDIALNLIRSMLYSSYEELHDEIYVQLLKQIKRNPLIESIELGYQLLLILLSSISPSKRLLPYLLVCFINHIDALTMNQQHETRKFVIYCCKSVVLSFLSSRRKELPTIYELQRLLLGEKIPLKIICIDNSIVNQMIDSYTTVKSLEKLIIQELKISSENSKIFALFESYLANTSSSTSSSTPTGSLSQSALKGSSSLNDKEKESRSSLLSNQPMVSLLSYNDRLVDILSKWEKTDKISLSINNSTSSTSSSITSSSLPSSTDENIFSSSASLSSSMSSALVGNHYFLWKVNYYFPLLSSPTATDDHSSKKLLYYQGIYDVITGYYPHSLQDAIFLAALQLQYRYGDYIIGKDIKELRSSHLLSTILSSSWLTMNLNSSSTTVPAAAAAAAVKGRNTSSSTTTSSSASLSTTNRTEIESKIISIYKKFQHVSQENAMNLFLSYLQTWKLYGAKYYHVKGQVNHQNPTSSFASTASILGSSSSLTSASLHNATLSSSEKNLILAITLHSVIIIDITTCHFLADYHYEQIYSCGHSFESFVLIIGTKANQVKSYYRTNQGKEIEEMLRIYSSHNKSLTTEADNKLGNESSIIDRGVVVDHNSSIEVSN